MDQIDNNHHQRHQNRGHQHHNQSKDHRHSSGGGSSSGRRSDYHRHHRSRGHDRDRPSRDHSSSSSSSSHQRLQSQMQYNSPSVHQYHEPMMFQNNPMPFLLDPSQPFQQMVSVQQINQLPPSLPNATQYQNYHMQYEPQHQEGWFPSTLVTTTTTTNIYANRNNQPTMTQSTLQQPQQQPDPKAFSASALERLNLPPEKITENGIIPDAPYYDLPAGLIVPLIEPHEREYKPLNPDDLRLPLPKFPDENFLQLIDTYYKSDSKSRDNDAWDRGFIDMYLKQKEALAEMKR